LNQKRNKVNQTL